MRRARAARAATGDQGTVVKDNAPAIRSDQSEALRQAAFRRALSHSRRVRLLKIALPLAGLAIVGVFVVYSYLSVPGNVSFDVSESAYANGKLVMANPKLDGYTKEKRPYSMSAMRALQHVDDAAVVELEGLDAKLPVGSDRIATIGAERGIYDRENNTLKITSPVTVKTSDGILAKLKSANLDILKGILRTTAPLSISMKGVRIEASSMRVLDNGHVLLFDKHVKLRLDPGRFHGGAPSN
jgi:lipopolysaccharide export system protein LptC